MGATWWLRQPRHQGIRSARTRALSSWCSSFLSSARPFASASCVAAATSSSASPGANPVLGGEPLDLPAELRGELAVVAGDQGAPVEREVAGRERVDGPADDVGDDELAGVDRALVGRPRDRPSARAASAISAASRAKSEAGHAAASARPRARRPASPERASRKART